MSTFAMKPAAKCLFVACRHSVPSLRTGRGYLSYRKVPESHALALTVGTSSTVVCALVHPPSRSTGVRKALHLSKVNVAFCAVLVARDERVLMRTQLPWCTDPFGVLLPAWQFALSMCRMPQGPSHSHIDHTPLPPDH